MGGEIIDVIQVVVHSKYSYETHMVECACMCVCMYVCVRVCVWVWCMHKWFSYSTTTEV